MTNPTSNFGWQMPTATDLVTDLPADFEVFGQAVDTDFVDLLGGTTGQILSKTSATDLDFTWIANDQGDITGVTAGTGISGGGTSGTVTVTNSMATAIDAKGDLVAGTAADTFSRLAIGTNATVLTADSAEATGMKWATPTATAQNFAIVNSGGTALSGSSTVTVSGITNANALLIRIDDVGSGGASTNMSLRINADSGSNYQSNGLVFQTSSPYAGNNLRYNDTAATSIPLATKSADSASKMAAYCLIFGGNSDGLKVFQASGSGDGAFGSFGNLGRVAGGFWNNSATITSVSIIHSSGNFTGGTIYVYKSS